MLELEPNLADEQLMEIVEEVDEDGSGTIDFDGNVFNYTKVYKILLYNLIFHLDEFAIIRFFVFTEFMGMMMG